jgi:adenylate cyclase
MKSQAKPMFDPAEKRRFPNRIPLFIRISSVVVFLVLLTFIVLGLFILKRQKDIIYLEKVKAGEAILNHFVNNVRLPFLEDDTLSLNTLVKEATFMEGILYAVIADPAKIIKAHTDPTKTGSVLKQAGSTKEMTNDEDIEHLEYTLPSGTHVLHLSRPVTFKNKILGSVHLGLSLDFINNSIEKETLSLLCTILFMCLLAVMAAIGTSFFLSMRLTRPISQLILAAKEIREGNFGYKIKKIHNSELGDSAIAFNHMSTRLHEKFPLIKAFSGEANAEIFNRDLANSGHPFPPEITRNQVTVIFAGIKGFKAYANAKAPDEILQDLNEYFAIAVDSIRAHGGHIDKFIGDAVIGVFESSPLQIDHAERAVRAAVTMQTALQYANDNGNQLFGRVGVGISSGVVLSGNIGSHSKVGYTFIGESFRIAYSLNVMAGPGEIVISKEVYQLIENLVSVEPLPPREIIDQSESWEYFRLHGIREKKNGG